MRRWARDGGAGGAGEEGVERAEVRGAAVRAAGAGAHPAQPPPQGTARVGSAGRGHGHRQPAGHRVGPRGTRTNRVTALGTSA